MNPGATTERIFLALKEMLMNREVRPGAKLDPGALASILGSSVTPVRDALHILSGAGLVESRSGEGFHVPPIDEPALSDLYSWNAEVLVLATRRWKVQAVVRRALFEMVDVVEATASIFRDVADRSANLEHLRAIDALNVRLNGARLAEIAMLDDIDSEALALAEALNDSDTTRLRRLIQRYHRRRVKIAANIVRHLYRDDGEDTKS